MDNEKTLQQKQKEEALKRMKLLQIMKSVIDDFKKNDKLYYSERLNSFFNATLYWVSNHKNLVKVVEEFESKYNALVYHCQLTHTECGDLFTLLYVSANEEEWETDTQDLLNGEVFARVENLDSEYDSDFGYVGIRPSMGGVLRTY